MKVYYVYQINENKSTTVRLIVIRAEIQTRIETYRTTIFEICSPEMLDVSSVKVVDGNKSNQAFYQMPKDWANGKKWMIQYEFTIRL